MTVELMTVKDVIVSNSVTLDDYFHSSAKYLSLYDIKKRVTRKCMHTRLPLFRVPVENKSLSWLYFIMKNDESKIFLMYHNSATII
jgi:hypothetical protein